jgi:hypothetical protein
MREAEGNQEGRQPKDEFWSVASEIWMALVVVAFFAIRILGSETARALFSRWGAR